MTMESSRALPSLTFLLVLMTFAISGCSTATGVVAVPGAGDETVTNGVRRAVREAWPGAELGLPAPMSCAGGTAAPVTLVRGDFNGDGAEDVALAVDDDGTRRLVAGFARLEGEYSVIELGDGVMATPLTLDVVLGGSVYQLESLTVDFFFSTDTVVTRACDGQRTAWIWTGDTFQPQRLAK